jgi:hypothetical protein
VKHKILIIIGVAVVAGIGGMAIDRMRSQDRVGGTVSARLLRESTSAQTIEFEYPVIGQRAADNDMASQVSGIVASFKKDSTAAGDLQEGQKNELFGRFNRTAFNDRTASYLLDVYVNTGGAHGNELFVSRTYDIPSGRVIGLSDIFADVPKALIKIQSIATQQLTATSKQFDFGPMELETSGLEPKVENYSVFTVEGYSITFYFPPYQVFGYAAGPQQVSISFNEISDLLKPEFRPTE